MIHKQIMQQQATYIRFRFIKGEEVKYISHLDLMRTFQRTIRRSGLPVAYSSGFNPHQELSFGAPLSLGVTSTAEYTDIKFSEGIDITTAIDKLNNTLPKGLKILDGRKLPEGFKSAMSLVSHARYSIRLVIKNASEEVFLSKLEAFLDKQEIKVMKQQPKKDFELKEIDIKPMIISIKLMQKNNDEYYLNCMLQSGSKANLKPELLIAAFAEFSGFEISGIKINREEVYTEQNGKLLDLLEYMG